MPSLVQQSTGFRASKIALVSQGMTEDRAGLVTVTAVYTCTASNNDYWSSIFKLDSRPPVWPTLANASQLQQSGLFMGERSLRKANGIVEISATYYGALQSALSAKHKTITTETRTVDFVATTQTATSTTRLQFRANNYEYLAAVVNNARYNPPTPTVRQLIVALLSSQTIGATRLLTDPSRLLLGISSVVREEFNSVYTPSVSVVGTRFTLATQQSISS
jgi:hypothetical protein